MLKGKPLYKKVREFSESKLPELAVTDDREEEQAIERGVVLLGIALAVDIAESLHKIANKD